MTDNMRARLPLRRAIADPARAPRRLSGIRTVMPLPTRLLRMPRLLAGVSLTLAVGLAANAILASLAESLVLRQPAATERPEEVRALRAGIGVV